MATKLGNDYKLFIADVSGGTFSVVKGQGNLSKNAKADTIDTTSKDDFPYKTAAAGSKSLDLSLDIKVNLPDATGYTRLETLANAAPQVPFNLQVRKSPFAVGDAVFQASVYCTDLSVDLPQDGVVSAKGAFNLAAPPTIDVLA